MGKPTAIGALIRGRLASLGIAKKIKEAAIAPRWTDLVGPEIAAHTRVVKLDTGRLFVAVDQPTWRQELMYQKEALVAKLNHEVGEDEPIVTDIMFIGP